MKKQNEAEKHYSLKGNNKMNSNENHNNNSYKKKSTRQLS